MLDELQTIVPTAVVLIVVVSPTQTLFVPVIAGAAGFTFTVTVCVAVFTQPPVVVTEYVIMDVPAVRPVTNPDALTEATKGVALDHVPPDVVLVHVSVEPIHSAFVPEIVWVMGADTVTVCAAEFIQPLAFITV